MLHTDHCAKKLLPWLDGMMDADEDYFKVHGEPLFSSHMIDLSEEPVDWNIQTTEKYLKRAAPMKQWLEMVSYAGGKRIQGADIGRKSASPAVRKMVSAMKMSTITHSTPSQRISTISGLRSPKSALTSPLLQASEMFMVSISLAT